MRYGFAIDHERCIGCHACTVACKAENDVPVGNFRTWVKYNEVGEFPEVRRHFAVLRCNHCTDAPCVTICPVVALNKRPDAIVDLDRDACIGCKACLQACPYDALYINEERGCAEKCHFCAHRIDQGMEPACVIVCPEQAIIAGDLDDPSSKISEYARRQDAVVRRPEQGTGPKVLYVGTHPSTLEPGTAQEPPTYLWSERAAPPPDWPAEHQEELYPQTRTVLDVHHPVVWGWKVSSYLVTKGIGAGAAMLAPFVGMIGAAPESFAARWWPELVALLFTSVTTLLLVADLKRPHLFLTLLTRPNTKSWLVKGAWILIAFSSLSAAILAARVLGNHALADLLRWPNVVLGVLAGGYTAFLFRQCEGRDLWQDEGHLFAHLMAQAILLGAAAFLPLVPTWQVATLAVIGGLAHWWYAHQVRTARHDTANARQAASLLDRIPAWRGSGLLAYRFGLDLTTFGVTLMLALVVLLGSLGWPTAALLALIAAAGVFFYEQAFVRAGQLPPLS